MDSREGINNNSNQGTVTNKEVALPFGSDEFSVAWSEWVQHRKEIKKKMTALTIKKQLNALSKIGESRSIAAIENSITKGYQGIYEETNYQSKPAQPAHRQRNNNYNETQDLPI